MKKPYYRSKGKYKDGRQRIVIEIPLDNGKKLSVSLPKPEIMLKKIGHQDLEENCKEKIKKIGH